MWQVHSKSTEVDFDDLSSGEKSVIQMFFPLLEHEIRDILGQIKADEQQPLRPEICVLIDEPELHLHPNLQVKVFDYLRLLTASGKTQAIVVSHSPTIVEHATYDELFLLRPVELVGADENQLIQIANDEDRLKLMRDIFGTTSNVTAMQPIVIVEGVAQNGISTTASDRKLYRALSAGFDAVTVLPGGGKAECLRLAKALNDLLPYLSRNLEAVALLDRDTADDSTMANAYLLPVSMIENFLLDPLPLWESIQSVVERTGFSTIDELTVALDAVLTDLENEEIDRRTKAMLGTHFFRPESPISDIPRQAANASESLLARYSTERVETVKNAVQEHVEKIARNAKRRENFHGKAALELFYRRHLHSSGLAKNIFKYEATRHARERQSVKQFFDGFFRTILKEQVAPSADSQGAD